MNRDRRHEQLVKLGQQLGHAVATSNAGMGVAMEVLHDIEAQIGVEQTCVVLEAALSQSEVQRNLIALTLLGEQRARRALQISPRDEAAARDVGFYRALQSTTSTAHPLVQMDAIFELKTAPLPFTPRQYQEYLGGLFQGARHGTIAELVFGVAYLESLLADHPDDPKLTGRLRSMRELFDRKRSAIRLRARTGAYKRVKDDLAAILSNIADSARQSGPPTVPPRSG